MCNLVGITDDNIFYDNLKNQVFERVGRNESRLKAIEDLGLLSDEMVVKHGNPIDTISIIKIPDFIIPFANKFECTGQYLSKRLALGPTDRDLVVLRHEVGILWPDNRREQRNYSKYSMIICCLLNEINFSKQVESIWFVMASQAAGATLRWLVLLVIRLLLQLKCCWMERSNEKA